MSRSKTKQQLNRKKCISFLSNRIARVKTIIIDILLHNQSISIKQFHWLSTLFMLFYWRLFCFTYEISNIFTVLATCLNVKRIFFRLNLCMALNFGQISEGKNIHLAYTWTHLCTPMYNNINCKIGTLIINGLSSE